MVLRASHTIPEQTFFTPVVDSALVTAKAGRLRSPAVWAIIRDTVKGVPYLTFLTLHSLSETEIKALLWNFNWNSDFQHALVWIICEFSPQQFFMKFQHETASQPSILKLNLYRPVKWYTGTTSRLKIKLKKWGKTSKLLNGGNQSECWWQ